MTSKFPALPPHGWQRFRPRLSAKTLSDLHAEAKARDYVPVFKEVGGKVDDRHRSQSRLSSNPEVFSDAMKTLHQELCYLVRSQDRNYVPMIYSFIKSEMNGPEQEPHQDYEPDAIEKVMEKYPDTVPCSMIAALEEGTSLKVFDSCFTNLDPSRAMLVDLYPGDCLLFRGDLIHFGVAYGSVNYRLHCYVTVPGVGFVPDIVASVTGQDLECKFCGYVDADSNGIRQHRFYCKENPKATNGARVRVRNRQNRPKEPRRQCPRCEKWLSAGGYRKHRNMVPPCIPKHTNK